MLDDTKAKKVEALILQCAFGSLGAINGPLVGEIDEFVFQWSKIRVSKYQLQGMIDKLVARKWLIASKEKIGTRNRRRYEITEYGVLCLISMTPFVNPSFKPLMENIGNAALEAMRETTAMFLAQGGPNGKKA